MIVTTIQFMTIYELRILSQQNIWLRDKSLSLKISYNFVWGVGGFKTCFGFWVRYNCLGLL